MDKVLLLVVLPQYIMLLYYIVVVVCSLVWLGMCLDIKKSLLAIYIATLMNDDDKYDMICRHSLKTGNGGWRVIIANTIEYWYSLGILLELLECGVETPPISLCGAISPSQFFSSGWHHKFNIEYPTTEAN